MKAPRWWLRVPYRARRLLVATLLGVLVWSVAAGLLVDPRWFGVIALAPVTWIFVIAASWTGVRSQSKIEAWERAKAEAQERDRLEALDALRDRRVMKRD